MIKMFGWEEKTKAQLREKRKVELGWLKFGYYLNLANKDVGWVQSVLYCSSSCWFAHYYFVRAVLVFTF